MSWSTVGLDELLEPANPSFLDSDGFGGGCVIFMVRGAGRGFDELFKGLVSIKKRNYSEIRQFNNGILILDKLT